MPLPHTTDAWKLYEQGRDYHNRLIPSQYRLVETNNEFYAGNQWLNLPETPAMRGTLKPVFNILKRITNSFVSSLTRTDFSVHVTASDFPAQTPIAPAQTPGVPYPSAQTPGVPYPSAHTGVYPRDPNLSLRADAALNRLLKKLRFRYRLHDALFDAARTGDYCAHFWFDPSTPNGGEIRMELVDGIDVMFGNPNDCFPEHQPYILLVGRDTVANLQREADYFAQSRPTSDHDQNPRPVRVDQDRQDFPGIGGRTEIRSDSPANAKALYLLLYTRHGSTIHVTKATRETVIYENLDTGLSRYPIAWGNWEKQKHQYHGRALITELIPNQIFINTMFAAAFRHLQLAAFPKVIYNADLIPRWTNQPGDVIGVHNLYKQDIASAVHTIRPAEMSEQIFTMIDKAVAYTKECAGATDVQLGTATAQNTSALLLLQTNAEVSLESIRIGMHEWVESCAAILLDMLETYRPDGVFDRVSHDWSGTAGMTSGAPGNVSGETTAAVSGKTAAVSGETAVVSGETAVVSGETAASGTKQWETLDIEVDMGEPVRVDDTARRELLDELRKDGAISAAQYIARLPDSMIPHKQELLDELHAAVSDTPDTPKTEMPNPDTDPDTPKTEMPNPGADPDILETEMPNPGTDPDIPEIETSHPGTVNPDTAPDIPQSEMETDIPSQENTGPV